MNSNNPQDQKGTRLPLSPERDAERNEVQSIIEQEVAKYMATCRMINVQCVGVPTAAKLLAVEEDTVRCWIRKGKLHASKVGNEYLIQLESIEDTLKKNKVVVAMSTRRLDKRFKNHLVKNQPHV